MKKIKWIIKESKISKKKFEHYRYDPNNDMWRQYFVDHYQREHFYGEITLHITSPFNMVFRTKDVQAEVIPVDFGIFDIKFQKKPETIHKFKNTGAEIVDMSKEQKHISELSNLKQEEVLPAIYKVFKHFYRDQLNEQLATKRNKKNQETNS